MRSVAQYPAPLSLADIRQRLNPPKGAVLVRPAVFYDTVTYPAAGPAAGARLSFFSTAAHLNDPTLSNMDGFINQFQPGQSFYVTALSLDILSEVSINAAAAVTGIANDIAQIVKVSRSYIEFIDKSKRQTRQALPLHMIGSSGAIESMVAGNPGAAGFLEAAHVGGGPTPYDALLAEQSAFQFDLVCGVGGVAVSGNTDIRLGLHGWLYQE